MDDYRVSKNKLYAYTFEVVMIVQVLATEEQEANELVDEKGGTISSRKVRLVSETPIPSLDTEIEEITETQKGS